MVAGLIVTPNLDHLRLLALSAALRRAYAEADVVLNDSRFLDRLALRGRSLCWPGSDLAPAMLTALAPGARVVMIGGGPAVQAYLVDAFSTLDIAFLEPSMGYIHRRAERRALVAAATDYRLPDRLTDFPFGEPPFEPVTVDRLLLNFVYMQCSARADK